MNEYIKAINVLSRNRTHNAFTYEFTIPGQNRMQNRRRLSQSQFSDMKVTIYLCI